MLHYCLLYFLLLRIFLKEIENCIENPELLARCFLKRVSKSFCRFVWKPMVLQCLQIHSCPFTLLLWVRWTYISRYSQSKPQACILKFDYLVYWQERSVTSVLPKYFKPLLKKPTVIQMFFDSMLFISDKFIPAVWCSPDTTYCR